MPSQTIVRKFFTHENTSIPKDRGVPNSYQSVRMSQSSRRKDAPHPVITRKQTRDFLRRGIFLKYAISSSFTINNRRHRRR